MGTKYSHLSIEDRKIIEQYINIPTSTLHILADLLGKTEKCIKLEIIKHRSIKIHAGRKNKCGKQNMCNRHNLCNSCENGTCKFCRANSCNDLCKDFIDYPVCKRLKHYPYVCTNCSKLKSCILPKYFYISSLSQNEYETSKLNWRFKIKCDDIQLAKINTILNDNINKGISPSVINNKYDLGISTSTLYRYIAKGLFDVRNINLKRQCRYIHHTKDTDKKPKEYDYLKGRAYADFKQRMETELNNNTNINVWEMDTVIGKRDGKEKCILTLLHRPSNLQLLFLLESKTSSEVTRIFDYIKEYLSPEIFKQMFAIILTDNGSEFKDPESIENNLYTNEKLVSVYYCQPRRSDQKGQCEKNHEHLRECIPNGISMNSLTQKDINFVSNMINNYPRQKFNYNSPLEIASKMISNKVFELNKLKLLKTDQIILKPIIR